MQLRSGLEPAGFRDKPFILSLVYLLVGPTGVVVALQVRSDDQTGAGQEELGQPGGVEEALEGGVHVARVAQVGQAHQALTGVGSVALGVGQEVGGRPGLVAGPILRRTQNRSKLTLGGGHLNNKEPKQKRQSELSSLLSDFAIRLPLCCIRSTRSSGC